MVSSQPASGGMRKEYREQITRLLEERELQEDEEVQIFADDTSENVQRIRILPVAGKRKPYEYIWIFSPLMACKFGNEYQVRRSVENLFGKTETDTVSQAVVVNIPKGDEDPGDPDDHFDEKTDQINTFQSPLWDE